MATPISSIPRSASSDETNARRLRLLILVITLSTKIVTSSLGGCRDVLSAKAEAWFVTRLLRPLLGANQDHLKTFILLHHIYRQTYVWTAVLTTGFMILTGKNPNSSTSFLADLVRSAGYLSTIKYSYSYLSTTSLVWYSWLLTGFVIAVGILAWFTASKVVIDLMIVIKDFTLRTSTSSFPLLNLSIRAIMYLYQLLKICHREVQRLRDQTFPRNKSPYWGQPYAYSHLDQTHIRSIKISRKTFFGQYRCRIVHTALASAPRYEAISYTWGSLPNDRKLYIDEWLVPVTQGILDVIDARASFFGQKFLWIDSICINQDDKSEKATQIQLMRNIYFGAKVVIAWLGPAPDADQCLRFLVGCAFLKRNDEEEFVGIGLNETVRKAFFNFLGHPYWERAWIIQEIVVAQNITVIYGNNHFSWDLLAEAVCRTSQSVSKFTGNFAVDPNKSAIVGLKQASLLCHLRDKFHVQNVDTPLDQVLTLTEGCRASDPRDKVYAVLGLTTSVNEPSIKPDYTKTKSQLCVDVARHLSKYQPLGVLNRAGLGHRRSDPSLPSWVPDYTEMSATAPLPTDHTSTPEHLCFPTRVTEASVVLHSHLPVLTTQCLIFDSISQLGPIFHSRADSSGRLRMGRPEDADTLFEIDAWVRSHTSSIQHARTDQSFDDSLWRTMVGNACCVRGQQRTRPAPVEFGEQYQNLILQHKRLTDPRLSTVGVEGEEDVNGKDLEGIFNRMYDSYALLVDSIMAVAPGRRIAITENGALAWVPQHSLRGDRIGAIQGGQSCIAMRKEIMPPSSDFDSEVGNNTTMRPDWRYVGTCYVHGSMDGEALDIGTWHQIHFW